MQFQGQGATGRQQQQQQGDAVSGIAGESALPTAELFMQLRQCTTAAGFNELVDGDELRPHWRGFFAEMEKVGAHEWKRRWSQAQRLIDENGITYALSRVPESSDRPWQLDALPVMIPEAEWESVAKGLRQRATVLELALKDLFGPQQLVEKGIVPAAVLYAHPGFLTTVHDLKPNLDQFLHFYAADLGRSADGTWWVLADRCEAPSGAGYALENRVATSRMLPEAFRACHVQRLAPYFAALQETCRKIAPNHHDNPRIVVLSEGPAGDNYFEDAYLSRYLGYTLVQGSDLAVRDRKVWLKTLGGLYPVDVIVRRANSADLDPLEHPTASRAAIAGLVDALRAGNVAITNPIGSGLVESPVFMTFLPAICKALLGEDLLLPAVATWWCGEPAACEYVGDRLDQLLVKHAFRKRGTDQLTAKRIRHLPTSDLLREIQQDPQTFVGQERVQRSSLPNWRGDTVAPAHLALRTFLVHNGDDFQVMQGGLARTSSVLQSLEMSLLSGEGSKDAWIVGSEPPPNVSLLPSRHEPVKIRRSGADLPSRVADDVFWLGRHLARADAATRLVRSAAVHLTSESGSESHPDLIRLLRCLADHGLIEPDYAVQEIRQSLPRIERMLPAAICDEQRSGSLRSMLGRIYATGTRVRDRMSADAWRILVRIDQHFHLTQNRSCDLTDVINMANEAIADLASLLGMISCSMTRSEVFRFTDFGYRLEHAHQSAGLILNYFRDPLGLDGEVLESLLDVSDSLMTYRFRYLANLQPNAVLDLLISDETNPRSILFQLLRIEEHLGQLPRSQERSGASREHRLFYSVLHAVRMVDPEVIGEELDLGNNKTLNDALTNVETLLPQLSQALSHKYMAHSGPTRFLTSVDQVRMKDA